MSWRSHKFLRSQLQKLLKEGGGKGKLSANNRYKALMLYAELTEDQEQKRRAKTNLAAIVTSKDEEYATSERLLQHIEGRTQ